MSASDRSGVKEKRKIPHKIKILHVLDFAVRLCYDEMHGNDIRAAKI